MVGMSNDGMSDDTGRGRKPGRGAVLVVVGVLIVLAAVGVFLATRGGEGPEGGDCGGSREGSGCGGEDSETSGGSSSPSVPGDVLSAPGTELPGGVTVAPGSSLVGPAVVDEVDSAGEPASWSAVLAVGGDPRSVWRSYTEQFAELFPSEGLDPAQSPGCPSIEDDGALCEVGVDVLDGRVRRSLSMRLVSVPGDVTGGYLLWLEGMASDQLTTDLYSGEDYPPSPTGALPAPNEARRRPGVGEPLAPETVAYDGDNEEYVLLEGSELIAQYGTGSLTGGFGVLLRTTPGADLAAVAGAYAEQAIQFEGEPVPPPEVVEHDGTRVTVYLPPGGAGGYTGRVLAVDRPSGDDYIVYELAND
jgi:hypothetical protein